MYIILFTEAHTCYATMQEEKAYTDIRKAKNQLGIIKAENEGTKYNYYDKDTYTNEHGDSWMIKEIKLV